MTSGKRLKLPNFIKEFFEFLGYKDVHLANAKSYRTYVLMNSNGPVFFFYLPINDNKLKSGYVSYYVFDEESFDSIIEQWRLRKYVRVNDIHKNPKHIIKYTLPRDELEWEILKASV